MFFEITGCNKKNLGDVLMLEAAISELSRLFPHSRFAVRRRIPAIRLSDQTRLYKLPLLLERGNNQRLREMVNDYALAPLSRLADVFLNSVQYRDVNAIIDVCGYKYGGIWGTGAITSDIRVYSRAKSHGKKIVLLPKTYGPFSDTASCALMRELIDISDICLVRDHISRSNLIDIGVSPDRCPVYPDYTITLTGIRDEKYDTLAGRPLLIPNFRMVDAHIGLDLESYMQLLDVMCETFTAAIAPPVIVIHDFGKDVKLCNELAERHNLTTVTEHRAAAVKGLISRASVVYSDRLHGMINSLSQSIPVITTGWSHKYVEIMKGYGVENLMNHLGGDRTAIKGRMSSLVQHIISSRDTIVTQLGTKNKEVFTTTKQMWDLVYTCLTSGRQPET